MASANTARPRPDTAVAARVEVHFTLQIASAIAASSALPHDNLLQRFGEFLELEASDRTGRVLADGEAGDDRLGHSDSLSDGGQHLLAHLLQGRGKTTAQVGVEQHLGRDEADGSEEHTSELQSLR